MTKPSDEEETSPLIHQHERLTDLLDELDAIHGPVSEDVRREVAAWWPDEHESA